MSSHPVGGPHYLSSYPTPAYIYLIIAGSASVIGTVGNLMILGSIYVNKNLRKSQNVYIVNLALADLIITSFADPLGIMGMVLGKEFFESRPALCDVAATVCLTVCVTALLSIGGMSINRYFFICQGAFYRKHFTLRINILICLICWAAGMSFSLPGLLGWTNNVYDHKMMECIWDRTHSISFTLFFSVVIVFLPTFLIAISFIKIYLHVRASKRRIATPGNHPGPCHKSQRSSIKLARTLFIIFAIFVSCWSPYAILVLIDWGDNAPPEVHLFILLLAHMHSTLNAIVYFATNGHFRKGYTAILSKIMCGIIHITPGTTNSVSMSEERSKRIIHVQPRQSLKLENSDVQP